MPALENTTNKQDFTFEIIKGVSQRKINRNGDSGFT